MNLMIDSGAHSLFNQHPRERKSKNGMRDFSFYETDDFWNYVDSYCLFILKNINNFNTYVNVDVIFNAELSWKVQQYIESTYHLKPLPVFHSGEDYKWLKKYIDQYEYIGIGGLGQQMSSSMWCHSVGDPAFSIICDEKGYPRVKTHGFAMTSPSLIVQYPWASVDSTSWMQFGKYGLIVVPVKNSNGKYRYDVSPNIYSVSTRLKAKENAENFVNLSKEQKRYVETYLESIGLKIGSSDLETEEGIVTHDKIGYPQFPITNFRHTGNEIIKELGVCNNIDMRDQANLQYYLDLESNLPKWPRRWTKKERSTKFQIGGLI